jgi:hypothetical protein
LRFEAVLGNSLSTKALISSTYKSLGGPAFDLIVTNDAKIDQDLDRVAFSGLTAKFDVAESAALVITLLDFKDRPHHRKWLWIHTRDPRWMLPNVTAGNPLVRRK